MRTTRPRFNASVTDVAGQPCLVLSGVLDHGTAGSLRELLRVTQQPAADLVLDLSGVRSVDAAGLGVLVAGVRRARDAGGSLVVGRVSNTVLDVIRTIGLERMLDVRSPT